MENVTPNENLPQQKKGLPLAPILLLILIVGIMAVYLSRSPKDNAEQPAPNAEQARVTNADKKALSPEDITFEAINGNESGYSNAYAIKADKVEIGRMGWEGDNMLFTVVKVGQNADSVFLVAQPVGLGGYYVLENLMGQELYRVDLKERKLEKLYQAQQYESIQNVSPDGTMFAVVEGDAAGVEKARIINIAGGKDVATFGVPEKYKVVGHISFSSDNTKVAFEAAVGDPEKEEIVAFGANLQTKEQKQFASYKEAAAWAGVAYVEAQAAEE